MTIKEYVRQFDMDTIFNLEYWFTINCPRCKKCYDSLDEEYTFSFYVHEVGSTGYDWIFDFDIDSSDVSIKNFDIVISKYGADGLCSDCEAELFNYDNDD